MPKTNKKPQDELFVQKENKWKVIQLEIDFVKYPLMNNWKLWNNFLQQKSENRKYNPPCYFTVSC